MAAFDPAVYLSDPGRYFADLKARLIDLGVEQPSDFYRRTGLSRPAFWRYMRGEIDPRLSSLARLEAAVNELQAELEAKRHG